jgi:hypothetical protein|tara:strand:+ start:7599 stop:7760 length:162 start_codon:yes stop_codon:yes gene_type:complete
MILAIELLDGSVQNIDVGDLSSATMDEKTEALDTALSAAGIDLNSYIILGEAE